MCINQDFKAARVHANHKLRSSRLCQLGGHHPSAVYAVAFTRQCLPPFLTFRIKRGQVLNRRNGSREPYGVTHSGYHRRETESLVCLAILIDSRSLRPTGVSKKLNTDAPSKWSRIRSMASISSTYSTAYGSGQARSEDRNWIRKDRQERAYNRLLPATVTA